MDICHQFTTSHTRDDNAPCSETTISPCSLAHPRFQAVYLLNLQDQLVKPFLHLFPKQLARELELAGTQLEYLGTEIPRLEETVTTPAMTKRFSVSITTDDGHRHDDFGYLSLTPALLSSLFRRFFGGNSDLRQDSPADPLSTPLTRAEHYLLEAIAQCLLTSWQEVWHPLPSLTLRLQDTMSNDDLPLEGRFMQSRYRVMLTEESTGTFEISMPMSLLERIAPGRSGNLTAQHPHWRQSLTTALSQTPVELRAILAEQTLPLQKIMDFRQGDIVPLPLQETIVVNAADQPVFTARVGIGSGHLALAFLESLNAS